MSHVKFEFHSNRDTLTYFTAKNRSKSFFCIHGLKNYIEASDLVHTYIVSVLTTTDFCHGWAIFGPLADKNHSEGVVSRAPSQRKVFWTFYQHALRYQFETWYIHLVGSATHQVRVSSQSGHLDLLYSQEWVNVIFFIYGIKNYIEPSDLVPCDRFCVLILGTVN